MIAAVRETKTKTERVFDGNFLHIDRDTVTTASGLVRSREYIRHPGASVIIALFDDETMLMEFQWRQPCEKAFWELPAGKLDPNEKASVCARRELEEETGYQADQWYYLGRIHNAIGYSDEHLEFFLAKGLKAGDRHLDEGECLEVYRLPFKEVKEMTLNGDITDVKTIIGVFWLEKYLKGEMAVHAC
ncbi:NUDIX hydrolase [Parasutterella secunda]|nr:NUDIX hydrolase [Parasutterella secunda]MDM8113089.1 NUDIX hydrolase [Parasutterella secunda]MDM8217845.1 NUDIX hydrolase [Parasutterella secunda]